MGSGRATGCWRRGGRRGDGAAAAGAAAGRAHEGGLDAGQPAVDVVQAGPEVLVGGLQLVLVGVGVLLDEEGGDGGGRGTR